MKLNVDVVFKENDNMSIVGGGVMRDYKGYWLLF